MYIEFPRGDQKPLFFGLKNKNGEHLTDSDVSEITMTCRLVPAKTSPILFQKKLTNKAIVYDKDNKKFKVLMLAEDTKDLDYREYGFDIEVKAGDLIDTHTGTLKITDEFTMED